MISPNTFMTKSNNHMNDAADFIKKNKEFLTNSPVGKYTKHIVESIDRSQFSPEIGLARMREAVIKFMMDEATEKQKKSVRTYLAKEKDFIATIFDAENNVAYGDNGYQLQMSFDSPSEASGWVERRLNDGKPGWRGEVQHPILINGKPMVTSVGRDRAIANMTRRVKRPIMAKQSKSAPLTSVARAHGDKFYFSRG